ncbi:MAG: metalloregulator ArsR/SmtB family transcription factor [Gammaproteobacteria bacterium]|nr:metalloregulator ArsR/SmtB family transcription factor [Gammaproteobacteria bacterium]
MDTLLQALRAAGEPTRLRLLSILAHNELTVSELVRILGQSQPRVSRHLKLLSDARLVDRIQEGSWVFYRLADRGPGAELTRTLLAYLPAEDDALAADRQRLEAIKQEHAREASAYFRGIAESWDRVRSLYVPESDVEQAMLEAVGDGPVESLLDLGTGTGRILQVFASRIERGLGIDSSREMLAVARANLERLQLRHCQVRLGDIFHLSVPSGSFDVVTIHHVLHFLDDPGAAVAEAARALRRGGRLLIVDFAPHSLEHLRDEYAHRRLGFAQNEVTAWCRAAGIEEIAARPLTGTRKGDADKLTVTLWSGVQQRGALSDGARHVA